MLPLTVCVHVLSYRGPQSRGKLGRSVPPAGSQEGLLRGPLLMRLTGQVRLEGEGKCTSQ